MFLVKQSTSGRQLTTRFFLQCLGIFNCEQIGDILTLVTDDTLVSELCFCDEKDDGDDDDDDDDKNRLKLFSTRAR